MKKVILAISVIILLSAVLAVGIWLISRDDNDVVVAPTPTPEPTPMLTPTTPPPNNTLTATPTVEPPLLEPMLSMSEAEELLRQWFGNRSIITRLSDIDRQEDGVLLYAFSIDYTNIGGDEHRFSDGIYINAWVNSATGWIDVEEPYLYANIPDVMFPIPMRDGEAIPYEWFSPPNTEEIVTSYGFFDISVLELYKTQLMAAGFVNLYEYEVSERYESLWRYDRSDTGMALSVEITHWDEEIGFSVTFIRQFFPWLMDN